ncbi:MAG: DUF2238 domain-containing protein [Phycisphaerae bacterium]|nr:DUF2238 domain-containing protein [Phycisphaerae bacterium]
MRLSRAERILLAVNLLNLAVFAPLALRRGNDEFLIYAVVIVIIGGLVLWRQPRVRFSASLLVGLTVWAVLHMAGGILVVGSDVLYGLMVLPILDEPPILRYDQLVHAFGFGVATSMCYHVLRNYLHPEIDRWFALGCLVVLMGLGVGALNEIIEFGAVLALPQTGVGGYENTLLDLVFDLIGAIVAAAWIVTRERKRTRHAPAGEPTRAAD